MSAIIANSSLSFPSHRPFGQPHLSSKPRAVRFRPASAKRKDGHGSDFGGGLVDQDMVVLRKRIHDMATSLRRIGPSGRRGIKLSMGLKCASLWVWYRHC